MQVARLPWWIAQVFTQAKSFRDNPVLGNQALNRLGLHAARYALGHAMASLRRAMLAPLASEEHRRQFREQGYVIIHNVLPEREFARIREEMIQVHAPQSPGEVRECIQGDTATRMLLLDGSALSKLPAIANLLSDRRLQGLLMYVAARRKRPMFLTHMVENGMQAEGKDPQKDLHSDTFHSTMKAWYFVSDVRPEDGPFTYVPGSHRFSHRRLAWEHEVSIRASSLENRYSSKGSLRLTEADRVHLGYPAPIEFIVPGNTLIVSDTHGFHRRGDALPQAVRVAIYASSRSNPFNPLPGFLPSLAGWIEARALRFSWRLDDRKARAKGGLPSWRLVGSEGLAGLERKVRPSLSEAVAPDAADLKAQAAAQP